MALSNYTELKASIISWSHRGGLDLLIDDFILLAETEMYDNPIESLRIREIETRSTASTTTTSRYLALPDDYLSMRSLRIDQDEYGELEFRTPEQLNRRIGTGQPTFFAVTTQIEFDILPDDTYPIEMNYMKSATGLSSSNPTNVVLTNNANMYLFGSLWALFTHADDEEQAAKYYTRFIGAIRGANSIDRFGRFGPNPVSRVEGPTP